MSLSAPAELVRSMRAHGIEPVVFCTHLLHTATSGDGTVVPDQTAAEFDIHRDAATYLHDLASEFGLVKYTTPTSDRVKVDRRTLTKFIQFIDLFDEFATETEVELLADDAVHEVDLTIAVPEEFEGRPAELMARLIRLVRNSETELLIITPFFTRFGVDTFVDHLAQATNRGVHVTILTRDVTDNGDNAGHIGRIHDTVAETGEISNLRVYEYNSQHGRLHAKALISDREEVYVGSANFTNYSLKEAIEIGVIVRGPVVMELVDFFSVVQSSKDTQMLGHSPRYF